MRLLYVFCLPLTTIALLAQTAAPNSTSSQQSPVTGHAAPLFNATARNVVLDAVVTDKTGNVVGRPDLKVQTRDGYYAMQDNQALDPKREFQELTGSLRSLRSPSTAYLSPSATPNWLHRQHLTLPYVSSFPAHLSVGHLTRRGRLSAQITVAAADKGKHGKRGAWQPSVLHVYTVSLPDGVASSPATQTSVNFEMPYRDSDRLRFIVRDDASGRVGSSEITLSPAKTS
jgi:hypothetical protein